MVYVCHKYVLIVFLNKAFKHGLYGKDYVWIWSGTFYIESWIEGNIETDCSADDVITAAAGHFSLHTSYMSVSNNVTITGKVGCFVTKANVNICQMYELWVSDLKTKTLKKYTKYV